MIHEHAVMRVAKYLMSMSTYMDLLDENCCLSTSGVKYNPYKEKGIECYVDTDSSGGWDQVYADNVENFMLHTR